jgi:hypothetical protein
MLKIRHNFPILEMADQIANLLRRFQLKNCTVELRGTDNKTHSLNLAGESLFDVASKALDACCKLAWYNKHAVLTVQADGKRWKVDPERVREWRDQSKR